MRLFLILLALLPADASAFLFGRSSDKKAGEMLRDMEARFYAGDCAGVASVSEALFREKPPSAIRTEAYSYMGRCYESREMPDKAMAVYKLAHGLYPENAFFSARLAGIYMRAGFCGNAIPLYERALDKRPDDIPANAGLAKCFAAQGALGKAKAYFSKAAILGDFSDAELLRDYAEQMLRKRDWEEAELIAGYALKLDAGDARMLRVLGRAAAGRGDYALAAERLRRAALADPASAALRLEAALAGLLAGETDQALEAAPAAEAERNPLAALIRGLALRKKGDERAAAEYIRMAAAGQGQPFVSAFAAALNREAR